MYYAIKKYLYSFVKAPTLGEIIEQKMKAEAQNIMDSAHVIKAHTFQKHMSVRTLMALEDWNRKERENEQKKGISHE